MRGHDVGQERDEEALREAAAEVDRLRRLEWYAGQLESVEEVWPVFRERGYSRDAALIYFGLVTVRDRVLDVEREVRSVREAIEGEPDDDGPDVPGL